jgi:hypothetical protein
MPSTYTLNNGIELIGTGEQSGTWGDTTNTNLGLLDAALDGQVTITLAAAGSSGSPNALPITDGTTSNGRNRMVVFADGGDLGATAYVQLTPNDAEKIIYIRNSLSGSRSVILFQGTYNASNDYEVPAGTTAVVYFDGAGAGAVAANVFNNAYFDGLRLGSVSVTAILDEDNMASDSATALATQQSIKAYVDSQVGTVDTLAEILAIGNTTGATDIAVDSAQKVQFRDAAIYINSSVDGQLDIVADTEIQIAATTIDVNGALDVSGTALVTGVLTTTAATVSNGGGQFNGAINVGVDDTGYDVKFFGATAGAYMLWDESADDLILGGAAGLSVNSAALVTGVLTTTAATVFNGGFAANQESTIIAVDGAADNAFALIVKNQEATDGRSQGVRIDAGSNASDAALVINDHDASTSLFRVKGSGVVEFVDGTASLPSITNFGDLNTGIFFPAADTIAFAEGGAEAARFDSSQRVLIGTTTSRSTSGGERLVQIEGVTGVTSSMSITRNTNAATGPSITLAKTRGTAVGADTIVVDDDSLGAIVFSAADGTNADSRSAEIEVFVDGTPGENDTPGRLVFSTTADGAASTSERMRIDNAGRVLINYADIPTGSGTNKGLLQVANSDTTYDWTQINTDANGYASTANEIAVINSANNDVNGFAGLFMQAGETTDGATISAARIGAIRAATSSAATDLAFAVRGGNAVMSEAMRIDSSQRVLIGATSTRTVDGYNQHLLLEGAGITKSSFAMVTHTNDANGAYFYLSKARGTTIGGSTIVQDGDVSGAIVFTAADGTDMTSKVAQIQANVDGTPGSNDMPGSLQFYTTADGASSVTERMRIDDNGNVRINNGAAANFTVDDDNSRSLTVAAASNANAMYVAHSSGRGVGYFGYDGGGDRLIIACDNGSGSNSIQFSVNAGSSSDTNNVDGIAAAMTIDSLGNLLLGKPANNATVQGINMYPDGAAYYISDGTGAFDSVRFYRNETGITVGRISTTGTATSYVTSSDYRLKTDAQPMTGASDRVLALKPVNFEWISDGSRVDGFLAHEAQEVVPECVTGTKDAVDADGNPDYQGIDQSKLVPLLTAALQEALTKIETLEARITALENA